MHVCSGDGRHQDGPRAKADKSGLSSQVRRQEWHANRRNRHACCARDHTHEPLMSMRLHIHTPHRGFFITSCAIRGTDVQAGAFFRLAVMSPRRHKITSSIVLDQEAQQRTTNESDATSKATKAVESGERSMIYFCTHVDIMV